MATTKPDHAAQRAAQAAAAAARAQKQAASLANHKAARQQVAAAAAQLKQTKLTAQQNTAASKLAAKLAAAQTKAGIAAALYQARHPQANQSPASGPIINVGGSSSPGSGGAGSVPDYALPPGQTAPAGFSTSAGAIDSSNTPQPDGNAPKPAKSFYQQHKTAVIVAASIGGVILVIGLYGYAKYRAFTYPFRKAAKIIGVAQGAGRAIGGAVRS